MSIQIQFDAQLSTRCQKGEFPRDTIAAVYVTNRDDCSFQKVDVSPEGKMSVNFLMAPMEKNVLLTDRIKFHFYFQDSMDNNSLKPICAGHMPLVELADKVKDGGSWMTSSNWNTNTVQMDFIPNDNHSMGMYTDLLKLYNNKAITPMDCAKKPKKEKSPLVAATGK